MTRFSIIMPTFRREHIIHDTIQTIRNQTFENWELIVVDNAGSDYRFDDARIRYFTHMSERGASFARNFGIKQVTGQLACFFDDDDIMYPKYLETFDRVFQNPAVMMARCGMLTGLEGTTVNFSFATPEVVTRSEFIKPVWDNNDCHDQRYYQQIISDNGWRDDQVVEIPEVLVRATTNPRGGLRDPEGSF